MPCTSMAKRNDISLLLGVVVALFLFPLVSGVTSLAPIKQFQCVQLPQTCASCTYNNLSVVQYPNSTYALQGEFPMQKTGISYNYTFCQTNALGTYFVDGHGDINGVDTGWGGYTFEVNGSGQTVTDHQITLIMIGIGVLLVVGVFLFICSYLFKHPGVKIFFMALATLTLIVIIGVVSANADVYLAEFPNLVSIYNSYYIVFIALASAGMIGLVVWLIYYSMMLFNKSRGRIPEDD